VLCWILAKELGEEPIELGLLAPELSWRDEERLGADGEELLERLRAVRVEKGLFVVFDSRRAGFNPKAKLAFLFPGGGVPLTQHALAFGIALLATVLAVARFDSLRPGVRAVIAFTFGVLAAVNGGRHVHHMLTVGTTGHDVTGALALGAGVVLVGLAA